MNGSIPNVLIILLAVITYGVLAILIMRFALRASRGPETRYPNHGRARAPAAGVSPVPAVLPALDSAAALERTGPHFQALAPMPEAPVRPSPRAEA